MRVFLDTNVLASAFGTRGLCEDVLREVLATHELVVADLLLDELRRVLTVQFKLPRSTASEIIDFLAQETIIATPGILSDIAINDDSDRALLSCAIHAGANVFVTGDKELLELKTIGALKIVSPRTFWGELKK
jgi:putative PIN family toxin of toxin-antitoxin system